MDDRRRESVEECHVCGNERVPFKYDAVGPVCSPCIDDLYPTKTIPTYVRDNPKIGRNDKCSCGSGKKYKYCCL